MQLTNIEGGFLDFLALKKGYGETSLRSSRYHLMIYLKWLGQKPITSQICTDFLIFKKRSGSSNNYLRKIAYTLRHLCEFLNLDKKEQIPIAKLEHKEIQIPKTNDVLKLIKFPCKTRMEQLYSLLFEFLASTGMRLGEAVNLRVIDIEDSIAHIIKSKSGHDRFVPLPPGLKERIQELTLTKKPNDYVFCGLVGGKLWYSAIRRELNRRTKAMGLTRINPHKLRHLFITEMIRQSPKGGIATIAKIVGHVNPYQTLTTYQHLVLDDEKQAMAGFSLENNQKELTVEQWLERLEKLILKTLEKLESKPEGFNV